MAQADRGLVQGGDGDDYLGQPSGTPAFPDFTPVYRQIARRVASQCDHHA
jgi:hypothetical protein